MFYIEKFTNKNSKYIYIWFLITESSKSEYSLRKEYKEELSKIIKP